MVSDSIYGRMATVRDVLFSTVEEPRVVKDEAGREVRQFAFAREACETCRLFERCVRSKVEGRKVTLNYHEDVLREARQRQETEEYRGKYPERAKVERKIAELMEHGLRKARYVGRAKKRLQALWTAAVVNLKRLFKLAKGDTERLVGALSRVSSGPRLPSAVSRA